MAAHRTILLVEDEESVRVYFAKFLERNDWRVTGVRSGGEALAALSTTRFDVILCDLDLGDGPNGVEVQRLMPELSRGTPLVILTGHGTIERCRDAMQSGVVDFLEKPLSPARLLSALNTASGSIRAAGERAQSDEPSWPERVGDEHVRRALRTIEQNSCDPDFSVSILARAVDITPEHLARLFRTHVGRTPLEQIHETRIASAEKLLASVNLSVFEVALECGYRNTTELDVWFRRLKNLTPSEWRERRARGSTSDV